MMKKLKQFIMKKVPEIKPSKDPRFDELESLSIQFQETSTEETKSSSATDQFEQQLSELSVRQVVIKRGDSLSDYSYFL